MYAVVRRYRSTELFDELARNEDAVRSLITGIDGFVSYTLSRADDGGGFSVGVYRDRAGAEESTRRAREWVQANVSAAAVGAPPDVTEGEVLFHFDAD
jgi:hypothetical protein